MERTRQTIFRGHSSGEKNKSCFRCHYNSWIL